MCVCVWGLVLETILRFNKKRPIGCVPGHSILNHYVFAQVMWLLGGGSFSLALPFLRFYKYSSVLLMQVLIYKYSQFLVLGAGGYTFATSPEISLNIYVKIPVLERITRASAILTVILIHL